MEEIEQSNNSNIIITTTTPSKPTTTTTTIVPNSDNSNGKTPISNAQQQQQLGGLKRVAGTPLTPTFIQKNTRRRKISRETDGIVRDLVNNIDDDQNTTTTNNNDIDKGQDEEWDHEEDEEDEEDMATLHGSPKINRRKHVVSVTNTGNTNANTKIIKTFDDVDINFIDIRRHVQEINMMMDQFILLNDHNETKELLRFMIKEREQEKLYM